MGRNHRTHEANILQLRFSTRSQDHHATCNLQHNSTMQGCLLSWLCVYAHFIAKQCRSWPSWPGYCSAAGVSCQTSRSGFWVLGGSRDVSSRWLQQSNEATSRLIQASGNHISGGLSSIRCLAVHPLPHPLNSKLACHFNSPQIDCPNGICTPLHPAELYRTFRTPATSQDLSCSFAEDVCTDPFHCFASQGPTQSMLAVRVLADLARPRRTK